MMARKIFMTPEDSIQIQENLGSDIVMAFDECTDYPSTHEQAKRFYGALYALG